MVLVLLALGLFSAVCSQNFDFDSGVSILEVVIPNFERIAAQEISKTAGDATLVLRATVMLTNAWFDAVAPYHPTALGIYTQFPNRMSEATNAGKNKAVLYASYQVQKSLVPTRKADFDKIMTDLGLDPQLESEDINTPEGIGYLAGKGVV